MRVDEILATEARVSVEQARAACQEFGVNERIDLDNLETDLSPHALEHIRNGVAAARTKLKGAKSRP